MSALLGWVRNREQVSDELAECFVRGAVAFVIDLILEIVQELPGGAVSVFGVPSQGAMEDFVE